MKTYTTVLTIAGSDSGGGAGIQADLKTVSALGCFAMTAITAVTAQNTRGVTRIHPVPPDIVDAQIRAVFDDMGADAVKIGMLYSADLIRTVAAGLKAVHKGPVVLDPVMVAQSGDPLLEADAVSALLSCLLPHVTLVTPNLPEAEILTGHTIRTPDDLMKTGRMLAETHETAFLIKGGHAREKESTDDLWLPGASRPIRFTAPRAETLNNHGTGCTLSAAITAFLAKGDPLEDAVAHAKQYLTNALISGTDYHLGTGAGPVHHFHAWWS
ncbi:MAG: bifunctional hydroxymethylpyrimidine kinase/phosphomethylpyrimidine kinase [Deltaproteobacteria bacterium]|nr:MAG: bifunctional hydroxymethylpyrimidine kinase/phosphomethylpyrimidine kinase [Deltaproteobacteria bacterium]